MYLITFMLAGADETTSVGRRCPGDLALIRTLEAVVPDADVRRRALEMVRNKGHVSIRQTVLSEEQAATLGLGGRGRAGRSSAAFGWPEGEAQRLERDLTEEVAAFLGEADGQSFCHTCLAGFVGIEFEEARKAVYTLRASGAVRVGTALCSSCHQHRVSVEAG